MFLSLSRRRVILLVVLTCLLLVTLDKRGNPFIDRTRSAFAVVLRPFDAAVDAVALPIERAWNGIADYDDLERENEMLRDQVERMKGSDIEAQSTILEYRELLRLTQLTSKFAYETVEAQVVGDSPSNFQNTVEINVGSNFGVAVGMPVTDGAGLIGRITKVFPDHSIVLLLTDPEYAVSAQVLSTQDQVDAELPGTTSPGGTTPSGIPVEDLGATTTTSTTLATDPLAPLDPNTTTSVPTTTSTTTTLPEVVRETGTLEGQGAERPLLLRFVDTSSSITSIRVGAIVDTAGGNNSLAPQGIPIGTITRIISQSGSSTPIVEVTPNASLKRLNFVAVVLYIPNDEAVGR
jgi:rod shape-determining protein MreC